MVHVAGLLVSVVLALLPAPPDSASPADFKLAVALHGVEKDPVATSLIVVRQGIAYQFLSQARDEVQIIDPAGPTITLLHLKRRVQTEISAGQIESSLARLHQAIEKSVQRREKSDDRADRLSAAMSRDLIDPKFKPVYDAPEHRLRMSNPTVEVEAVGQPEPDARRLATIDGCLSAMARLDAIRDPAGLPPFALAETLRALVTERHLRPTEITLLYRLTGPPHKLRYTYRLVPELTDNDREAISRLDRLRTTARFVRYPGYEKPAEH
jgi:hypothetical protein